MAHQSVVLMVEHWATSTAAQLDQMMAEKSGE
jgi:hypothetical protein